MKRLIKFHFLLIFMAMPFLIVSCNGDEKKSEPEATAIDTTSAPAVNVNTIVTTPQLMALIKHKIRDYAAWKSVYDAHDSARLANGLHSFVIGRGVQDSMEILVAMKADDLEKAKAFAKDPGVKEKMKKGGVISAPEISFIRVMWQDTVNVGSIPRVMSTFMIKDWDTWKKVFEEGKQERIENGSVDRQYGHDADDNHKISLVVALTDSAKARTYWSSDALKKRREAGGLTTEPKRFIFNIVQRYRN
jgi:hypothetical protein